MKIFLKEHSFGNDWKFDETSSLFGFEYEWRGARFQFQDRKLDGALAAVKHKCRLLVSKLSEYSGPARGGVPRMTVKTEMDRMHGMSQETLAHIDELDTIATELYDAIDKLDDMARDRLAVASSTLQESEKTGQ